MKSCSEKFDKEEEIEACKIEKFRSCLDNIETDIEPLEEWDKDKVSWEERQKKTRDKLEEYWSELRKEGRECKEEHKEGFKELRKKLDNFFEKPEAKETVKFITVKGEEGPTEKRIKKLKKENKEILPREPPNIEPAKHIIRWRDMGETHEGEPMGYEYSLNICEREGGEPEFEKKKVKGCVDGELFATFHNHPSEGFRPSTPDLWRGGEQPCISSRQTDDDVKVACYEPIIEKGTEDMGTVKQDMVVLEKKID